jgi:hypothetical protein
MMGRPLQKYCGMSEIIISMLCKSFDEWDQDYGWWCVVASKSDGVMFNNFHHFISNIIELFCVIHDQWIQKVALVKVCLVVGTTLNDKSMA